MAADGAAVDGEFAGDGELATGEAGDGLWAPPCASAVATSSVVRKKKSGRKKSGSPRKAWR